MFPRAKEAHQLPQGQTDVNDMYTNVDICCSFGLRTSRKMAKRWILSTRQTLDASLEPWTDEQTHVTFAKINSITEGPHIKMELISRRAFGFRNYRLWPTSKPSAASKRTKLGPAPSLLVS